MTQEKLKSTLHYNPDNGIFTRLVNNKRYKVGDTYNALNGSGYITITIDQKRYLSHRLAFLYMNGSLPKKQVDHINHIRDDNRWSNLRLVSHVDNSKNTKKRCDNSSNICGVNLYKRTGKWTAYINHDKKRIHLGTFDTKEEAIEKRKTAEIKYMYHANHAA